jgi:hypothetical protein
MGVLVCLAVLAVVTPSAAASTRPVCVCGHTYTAHHGPGPCLVSVSTAVKQTKASTGKVFMGSVCPCQKYDPRP